MQNIFVLNKIYKLRCSWWLHLLHDVVICSSRNHWCSSLTFDKRSGNQEFCHKLFVSEMNSIALKCSVCGKVAHHRCYGGSRRSNRLVHYMISSLCLGWCCDSCRVFFRRTFILLKTHRLKPCKTGQNQCTIGDAPRKCTRCRYNKCLEVGMKPDMVQNDGVRTLARIGQGDGAGAAAAAGSSAASSSQVVTRRCPRSIFQHQLFDMEMCYTMEEDKWIQKLYQKHGSICLNTGSDWLNIVGDPLLYKIKQHCLILAENQSFSWNGHDPKWYGGPHVWLQHINPHVPHGFPQCIAILWWS